LTLSSTDVGASDPQWVCTKLNVEDVLNLGPHLVYYLGRVLGWLSEGAA
jgi:hypothetical protein